MIETFQANCLATLIGSLPLTDHGKVSDLIMEYTPEIPFWAQLPVHKEEGMMVQFTPGLPGFYSDNGNGFVNTDSESYDDDLLEFYEDYMAVIEGKIELDISRFALKEDSARGFFVFLDRLQTLAAPPIAVKGQITGPFTFGTGIVDQNKRPIFYDPQLRDAAVKLLAMKARWQVRRLSLLQRPVMIFFDEPALAGVGSSEFTSISNEDIRQCFEEVCEAVHLEGGPHRAGQPAAGAQPGPVGGPQPGRSGHRGPADRAVARRRRAPGLPRPARAQQPRGPGPGRAAGHPGAQQRVPCERGIEGAFKRRSGDLAGRHRGDRARVAGLRVTQGRSRNLRFVRR